MKRKGSVLIASLIAVTVLAILLALVYAIGYSYYDRSLAFESKNQAYYTAKSTADTLAEQIGKGMKASDGTDFLALLKAQPSKTLTFDFPVDAALGESCTVTASYDSVNGTVDIKAAAVKAGESYTVYLTVREAIDFTDTRYEEIIYPLGKAVGSGQLYFQDAPGYTNQKYFSVTDKNYTGYSNIKFENVYQKNVEGDPPVGTPMPLFIFIGKGLTLQLNNRTNGNNSMATDAPVYFILSDGSTLDFAGWSTPKSEQDIYVYGPASANVVNSGSSSVFVVDLSTAVGLADDELLEGYYPKNLLGARISTKDYTGSPYPLADFRTDLYEIITESGILVEYGPVEYHD